MATDPVTELMELVLANAGGTYLSDLHDAGHAEKVRRSIAQIPVGRFSTEAWSALADYVMHIRHDYETGEQAADAMLAYLADRAKEFESEQ